MARSVLLIEPDIVALGELASQLRSRGLTVALADGSEPVAERAISSRADALLLSDALFNLDSLLRQLDQDTELAKLPRFLLTDGLRESGPLESVPRADPELIAKRLHALPARPLPNQGMKDDLRGDLQQLGVLDLLQMLSVNRRTGSLSLVTTAGIGEIRVRDGQIVDALYRRLEAEKALFRLLAEREGTFAFTSTAASPPGRIELPTHGLLMEGLRQLDEVRRRREELSAEEDALLAVVPCPSSTSDLHDRVVTALQAPRTVDELLDELPFGDNEILELLERLLRSGAVRRIPKGAARVQLAPPEQMAVLGALASRLRAPGFSGPARLLLAGSPRQLGTILHGVQRIAEVVNPTDVTPTVPLPGPLATLRVGDGADLVLVGLPTVDGYSPLWGLALPGSAAVIRIEQGGSRLLDELCAVAGVPLLEASELLGSFDEADPAQIAALVRLAVGAVAGD